MIALPPLVALGQRHGLPVSDAAAVGLGEWFLSEPQDRAVETLAHILQDDPALALWLAWKVDHLMVSPPQGIADLAMLLAEHGLAWLQWPASSFPIVFEAEWDREIPLRAAVAILASTLAGDFAAEQGESARRQAELLGLLHNPQQWLTLAAPGDDLEIALPTWLTPAHFDASAIAAAEQAVRSIHSPLPGEGISAEYQHRCDEIALKWSAGNRAARWLPALLSALARLAALEASHRDAVETAKMAALAEFSAGAGHEINNPLAVIAGRAQLLLRDEPDPERRRDLAVINVQAMRVHEMIADLRLFANPPELDRQLIDLNALLRRLIDDMQPLAAGQETALGLVEAPAMIRVEADPVQLTVALRSLCQNALEALGFRGRIEIVLRSEGDEALISVSDDGPGLLAEHRPHIFEPFYSARQAGRGVGMGLSKCWRIVTQHGGRIDVASPAVSGARFEIRLPASMKIATQRG